MQQRRAPNAAGNLPGSCIAAAGRAQLPVSLKRLCGTKVMMVLVSVHAPTCSVRNADAGNRIAGSRLEDLLLPRNAVPAPLTV